MQTLVANTSTSVWTLLSMNESQMSEAFPDLRRFFQCGFALDRKNHADGIVGLISPMQTLRVNLETGDFE